ncbi:IS21 family transposase [Catalinimonas niigatensis]|uniref:IS21 family transposase n=1 Tax=Catalinimonas niigatensis TaxID=1397264 RepID=UPI002664E7E1|nr:IS21 family transposase [Catalinimonas niigatensis]WPP51784.1 IS21 family transposase [Catalinimonas niigatensis]
MSQIKQLILLHQQGKGRKTIARTLGMSKNTVKVYLEKLKSLTTIKEGQGYTIEDLFRMEHPVLEAKFHPGNPAYKDDRFEDLKARLDYYLEELTSKGVNKKLLWDEYREAKPDGYGYSQFCFHLHQQQVASKPSMVLDHTPAEKLYIDFAGKPMSYVDKSTGEVVKCQVFAACLPYSDYSFVMAIRSQSTEDFLYALSCCLTELGGVPLALVPDNLKAAVVKASRYEPEINRALEDFANHYGTAVVPARVRKPKDKALVENQVKLIYSRVYAKLRHMVFFDLHSLNAAIKEKVKAHNQTRMQKKPYCREERFLAEEKKLLQPLPKERYEIKYYRELRVAKNNHVYLSEDKHYYSVPYKLIGHKVKLIYTRSMVYIFARGEQVAVHIRNFHQGGYSTTKDHLCSQHRYYKDRSPEYYKRQAAKKSAVLYELVSRIFSQNRYPEQLYRTCDGLFGLERKTEPTRFEKACQMALDCQNYTYSFVMNVLENKMTEAQNTISERPLPKHNNLRGKAHYQQLELNYNTK